MNQASLYQNTNNVQRLDAKQMLEEYANVMQWRKDGHDSLIDIGSGSGNVLMDFVHPLLPENFEQLVGSDISAEMVSYASKFYAKYERTSFEVLDIGAEEIPKHLCERFDHVTSFYCLHWVQNQLKALKNIHQLLRSTGGDCLLIFLATNCTFDIYKTLSQLTKWSSYMQDYKQFISPLHHSPDPGADFKQLMQEAGFVDCKVEIRNQVYIYEGLQYLRDSVKAICPFIERIPPTLHEEFLDDFVNTVVSLNLRQSIENSNDYRFVSPYKLVVAYARKPDEILKTVLTENKQENCIK